MYKGKKPNNSPNFPNHLAILEDNRMMLKPLKKEHVLNFTPNQILIKFHNRLTF